MHWHAMNQRGHWTPLHQTREISKHADGIDTFVGSSIHTWIRSSTPLIGTSPRSNFGTPRAPPAQRSAPSCVRRVRRVASAVEDRECRDPRRRAAHVGDRPVDPELRVAHLARRGPADLLRPMIGERSGGGTWFLGSDGRRVRMELQRPQYYGRSGTCQKNMPKPLL